MTQVEDFWNIEKIGQTNKYENIRRDVIYGRCKSYEHIAFYHNDTYYYTEFQMYFDYDSATKKITIDRTTLNYIRLHKINQKRDRNLDTYYTNDQIESADLADMNSPISKAIRASNYAIQKMFTIKINRYY
jgi:hypothetical protein